MKLLFPATAEDLDDAFNNALDAGVMQRDNQRDQKTFWAKFQFLASDVDDDEIVQADWFHNEFSNMFIRVERRGDST